MNKIFWLPGWVVTYKNGTVNILSEKVFAEKFTGLMNDESVESFVKWSFVGSALHHHKSALYIG